MGTVGQEALRLASSSSQPSKQVRRVATDSRSGSSPSRRGAGSPRCWTGCWNDCTSKLAPAGRRERGSRRSGECSKHAALRRGMGNHSSSRPYWRTAWGGGGGGGRREGGGRGG